MYQYINYNTVSPNKVYNFMYQTITLQRGATLKVTIYLLTYSPVMFSRKFLITNADGLIL